MAAAAAMATIPHLFRGVAAPLRRHYHRRGCVSLTTTTTAGVINNHNSNFPQPNLLAVYSYNNNVTLPSSVAIARRRRRRQLLCYCTDSTDAQSGSKSSSLTTTEMTTTLDEDEKIKLIRDAGNSLDIRVGRIVKVWRHEEADSLYVEEVDVGEPEPRTICSGLVNYIPIHLLQDKNVIVLANLKPRNMRGVKSSGMLMAASDASHENVELLVPPEGAVPGERVWFGSIDDKENLPEVASPNQVQKKKIWELVQPHLKTDESCVAALGGVHQMRTSAGLITSPSLKNANIS